MLDGFLHSHKKAMLLQNKYTGAAKEDRIVEKVPNKMVAHENFLTKEKRWKMK